MSSRRQSVTGVTKRIKTAARDLLVSCQRTVTPVTRRIWTAADLVTPPPWFSSTCVTTPPLPLSSWVLITFTLTLLLGRVSPPAKFARCELRKLAKSASQKKHAIKRRASQSCNSQIIWNKFASNFQIMRMYLWNLPPSPKIIFQPDRVFLKRTHEKFPFAFYVKFCTRPTICERPHRFGGCSQIWRKSNPLWGASREYRLGSV